MILTCSIQVVEVSFHCLKAILATRSSVAILTKIEESVDDGWHKVLEPFKMSKRKKVISSISLTLYQLLFICFSSSASLCLLVSIL